MSRREVDLKHRKQEIAEWFELWWEENVGFTTSDPYKIAKKAWVHGFLSNGVKK